MLFRSSAVAFALTVSLVNGRSTHSRSYGCTPLPTSHHDNAASATLDHENVASATSDHESATSATYRHAQAVSADSDYASTSPSGYGKTEPVPTGYASSSPAGYGKPEPVDTGYTNNQVYASHRSKVVSNFATSQDSIARYGPMFEHSFQSQNVNEVISGLGNIRASILSLVAQLNIEVGIWISADLNVFANLYVSLLAKLQVVLQIIHTHGQVDACHNSLAALTAPLQALLSIFVNAGINVRGLLGVQVDLSLFVSVGISLGISLDVNANIGIGNGGLGGFPGVGQIF